MSQLEGKQRYSHRCGARGDAGLFKMIALRCAGSGVESQWSPELLVCLNQDGAIKEAGNRSRLTDRPEP
jgi:hypothetical protein